MSRYPTRLQQYIPAWTLWWVGMVHDYWWYVDDHAFVKQMLPGVRAVLSFFERHQKSNGSLGPLPWWRNFDWVEGWPGGDAPQEIDGSSAPFDLLLVLAYRWAADLEQALGFAPMGEVYRARERQLRKTSQELYWDSARQLYADTPKKEKFSQHSNTLAVLADVATGDAARSLMLKTLSEPGLAQSAFFFRFYVHLALRKAGLGDLYLDQLGDWREMLMRNLTTFAERADYPGRSARSDCHAWSASPNIEIFRTVLGIDSAAPAFGKVLVQPNLGDLTRVDGSVPHAKGPIDVALERQGERTIASVSLPDGLTGEFVWAGQRSALKSGRNRLDLTKS
jgi:alpha-L-rhamnosidase